MSAQTSTYILHNNDPTSEPRPELNNFWAQNWQTGFSGCGE